MIVLFARSSNPLSWIIRGITWSRWSHVGILTPDDTVIEADIPRVREVPLAQFREANGTIQAVAFPCLDPEKGLAWARGQIGKPYDALALAGMLAHRDWQNPRRWFCAELVAGAFQAGETPMFRAEAMPRVTPGHLWMLAGEDL